MSAVRVEVARMWLAQISECYRVPASIGRVVEFAWPAGTVQTGRIVGADNARIVVDFGNGPVPLHPTWNVTYREESGVSDT